MHLFKLDLEDQLEDDAANHEVKSPPKKPKAATVKKNTKVREETNDDSSTSEMEEQKEPVKQKKKLNIDLKYDAPAKKKQKRILQLPDDMKDLSVDMGERKIFRNYKVYLHLPPNTIGCRTTHAYFSDQLKRCLRMNEQDDKGLKAQLASRLYTYLVELASDKENDA